MEQETNNEKLAMIYQERKSQVFRIMVFSIALFIVIAYLLWRYD